MGLKYFAISATAGNADADHVVPDNTTYTLKWAQIALTTDVTVVNRWVRLRILDPDANNALCLCSGKEVAASQTGQLHAFMQGIYRETAFINGVLQVPIAEELQIPAGWTIRAFVENGAAGDSFSGGLMIDVN